MNCTRCSEKIEKGQKYYRTRHGAHHAVCTKLIKLRRGVEKCPTCGTEFIEDLDPAKLKREINDKQK